MNTKLKQNLTFSLFRISIIIWIVVLFRFTYGQSDPSTITFDNKSGEQALVKVIGPDFEAIEVPDKSSRTVNVSAGEYYILVRYGSEPEKYRYAKGEEFKITQTTTTYSIVSITLHPVLGGNYSTEPIRADEFEKAFGTTIAETAATNLIITPNDETAVPNLIITPLGYFQNYEMQQSINERITESSAVKDKNYKREITATQGMYFLVFHFKTNSPKTGELIRNDYVVKDNSNNRYYPSAISIDGGNSYFIMGEKFPAVTSYGETYIECVLCFELPKPVVTFSFSYKNQRLLFFEEK